MQDLNFNLNDIHYLFFVIPGFFLIWSYRFWLYRFSNQLKNIGEFEYAALSFIWGFFLLSFTIFLISTTSVKYLLEKEKMLNNAYSLTFCLLLFGFFFGWIGAFIKNKNWIEKIIKWISNIKNGRFK